MFVGLLVCVFDSSLGVAAERVDAFFLTRPPVFECAADRSGGAAGGGQGDSQSASTKPSFSVDCSPAMLEQLRREDPVVRKAYTALVQSGGFFLFWRCFKTHSALRPFPKFSLSGNFLGGLRVRPLSGRFTEERFWRCVFHSSYLHSALGLDISNPRICEGSSAFLDSFRSKAVRHFLLAKKMRSQ